MSEAPRVRRNCLACDHPELLTGVVGRGSGMSARLISLLDPAANRGFWSSFFGSSYESRALVCPHCGHVETVLKPEELATLRLKLGLETKKPS
jgi:hypothetical protein